MKARSLIFVSLMVGALWRIEIELRWGWASLDWINWIHFSVPIGAGIYLWWMYQQARHLTARRKMSLMILAAILVSVAFVLGGISMMWANNRWLGFLEPRWQRWVYRYSPIAIHLAIGVVYFGILYRLLRPPVRPLLFSASGYAFAFPITQFILLITNHRGGPDAIHAIKSGIVFSVIAFSLGFPLIAARSADSPITPQTIL